MLSRHFQEPFEHPGGQTSLAFGAKEGSGFIQKKKDRPNVKHRTGYNWDGLESPDSAGSFGQINQSKEGRQSGVQG